MLKYNSCYKMFDKKTDKSYTLLMRYTKYYGTCILEVDGIRVSSAGGGGYDKEGTCIGEWLLKTFSTRLKALDSSKYVGLRYSHELKDKTFNLKRIPKNKRDDKSYLLSVSGACGISCMIALVRGLQLTVNEVY